MESWFCQEIELKATEFMPEYVENISSPLGISEYQITSAVPENLKGNLPSIEALEQELGD